MDDIELLKSRIEQLEKLVSKLTTYNGDPGHTQIGTLHLDQDLAKGGLTIKTQGYTTGDEYDLITVFNANEQKNGNYASFIKSRGTIADPKPVLEGDEIFSFFFSGFGTDGDRGSWTAEMTVGTEGEIKPGIVCGNFQFKLPNEQGRIGSVLTLHSNRIVEFHPDAMHNGQLTIRVGDDYYGLQLVPIPKPEDLS
jgi:hypothetical protein